jgi:hypothetical protein
LICIRLYCLALVLASLCFAAMAPDEVIDLVKTITFRKDDWMGRRFPTSNVPRELEEFRDRALDIPALFRKKLLPNPTLSVEAFTLLSLLASTAPLVYVGARTCFINAEPTYNVLCLLTRKVPSMDFVKDAKAYLGQALLDGAQSILDPQYKGDSLPLWTIQFWGEMHEVLEAQDIWKRSMMWLASQPTGTGAQEVLDEARAHLGSLGWCTGTLARGGGSQTTTLDFARLLSNRMLNTSLVDIMVECIAAWVKADEALSEKFELVTLVFMNDINKATNERSYQERSPGYLHKLEERLRGSKKILLFPVHLRERVHFLGFEINYKKRTISYGELNKSSTEY